MSYLHNSVQTPQTPPLTRFERVYVPSLSRASSKPPRHNHKMEDISRDFAATFLDKAYCAFSPTPQCGTPRKMDSGHATCPASSALGLQTRQGTSWSGSCNTPEVYVHLDAVNASLLAEATRSMDVFVCFDNYGDYDEDSSKKYFPIGRVYLANLLSSRGC